MMHVCTGHNIEESQHTIRVCYNGKYWSEADVYVNGTQYGLDDKELDQNDYQPKREALAIALGDILADEAFMPMFGEWPVEFELTVKARVGCPTGQFITGAK